ncbi:hydrogenase iron-sulfur subunit [Salarchaeum sp. JOR-1]|uniref:hydrogenase iron-sulfur subunit n=1 Tax=Salarchaeum sp. JOR-1 TaxID=2599399 RepID=UPI001198CBEF|nr:hydrogenase iron-sulfur subunit [Salarchaeum sp. JOR-1]QDX41399.1 hydrogenase iron-sulfur subunit [Salarchaeum sp. JOR-1]
MNTGAFVCSCADTCDIDLEEVRDGVRDVDVVASSSLLCEDGLDGVSYVIDEHDLDQLIVTTPDDGCQAKLRDVADAHDLHPDAVEFVDHRESAGWVHERADATDKTARLINRASTGLEHEAPSRSVSRQAGERVAVVGDAEAAATLADSADVTLIAHGHDYADRDVDLDGVTVERGHVMDVHGEFGGFDLTVEARVTDDCVSCMKCVRRGPDDQVTAAPVDIAPGAEDGDWTECPTDAIDLDGTARTLSFDQVVHPGADADTRAGRVGFYTGPVDPATVAAVEDLLGGVEKPQFLDLEMDVCAAGDHGQVGCNACVDACPHGAVSRERVDSVEFDPVACENCGACTSSCPTGATRLREPSNERIAREVEAVTTSENDDGGWLFDRGNDGIETEVVAFVCSERAERAVRSIGKHAARENDLTYPPILPVRVNCTDTIGEGHVMHALAAGADGVAIVGCGDGCLHSGPDPKAALVDRLNTATTDLGLGERTAFFAPDPDDPHGFAADITAFFDGLEETAIPTGEHEATGVVDAEKPNPEFNSHDWTLESVREIVDHVDPERDVIRGLADFGVMSVSDDCTFTPTCSTLCPTDAIERDGEAGLRFNHERCVNCGLCEDGCVEDAITMKNGLDLTRLPENRDGEAWETVADGEMQECRRCGKPFTSQASAEKIEGEVGDVVAGIAPDAEGSIFEYCGDCRAKLVYDV